MYLKKNIKAELLFDIDRISSDWNKSKIINRSGKKINAMIKGKKIRNEINKIRNEINKKVKAISLIQALIKGKKIRNKYKSKENAISLIQASIKGKKARDFRKFAIVFEKYKKKTNASNTIKASILGKKIRNENIKLKIA